MSDEPQAADKADAARFARIGIAVGILGALITFALFFVEMKTGTRRYFGVPIHLFAIAGLGAAGAITQWPHRHAHPGRFRFAAVAVVFTVISLMLVEHLVRD